MMKRTLTKSKSKFSTLNKTTKSDDKNIKQNEKLHTNTNSSIGKNKKNKNNQNTISTVGSRNSMESKITKFGYKSSGEYGYGLDCYIKQKDSNKENSHKMMQLKSKRFTNKKQDFQSNKLNKKDLFINLKQNCRRKCENDEIYEQKQLISYREYCMVGESWVPMLTNTQRQRILNPFSENRSSFKTVQDINQSQKLSNFTLTQTLHRFQHQFQANLQQISEQQKLDCQNILKEAIQKLKETSNRNCTALFQQGISQNCKSIKQQKYQDKNQIQQIIGKQYQLLLQQIYENQIQKRLSNKQITNNGSVHQEQCNKQQKCQPQKNKNKNQNFYQKQQLSPVKLFQQDQQANKKDVIPIQPLQNLIKLRELKQLGLFVESCTNLICSNVQQQIVDTSIINAYKYCKILFQTIHESNYITQIITNLKYAWGFAKRQKLSRLRQRKSLTTINFVLPDSLFEYLQDKLSQNSLFNFIHNKCMFDFINFELNKLKPFYDSNGQTFPWSFSLISPLTFFQIQQNSLQIAFEQIRVRMIDACSMLCGLIVQIQPQAKNQQNNKLLQNRRLQRQNIMINKQLQVTQIDNNKQNMLQNQSTVLLLAISDEIFCVLLDQIISENMFIKQNL